ncbi:MAG: alpha/beta fold hydrolase [Egibacteraceae bacterium]
MEEDYNVPGQHTVTGGGGVRLHVTEAGNPEGQPVLFLHTVSHCGLSWKKQFESDLADDLRLVTMDLRGHGMSEKPLDVYSDSQLWAEDVHAVIGTMGLDHPFVVTHAYGTLVLCDYLRFYGDERLRGIQIEGGVSKLGSQEAMSFFSAELFSLVPGLFSNNVDEASRSLAEFVRLCGGADLSDADFYFWFGFNTLVPPYVREGMNQRVVDNDDVLSRVTVPALIAHGAEDPMIFLSAAEYHAEIIPGAKLSVYEQGGHSLHWQAPERYNSELRDFLGLSAK